MPTAAGCLRGLAAFTSLGMRWAKGGRGRLGVTPEGLWLAAHRELSARLVLAVAREQLIDATWAADAVLLPGLGQLALRRRFALGLHAFDLAHDHGAWLDDVGVLWRRIAIAIGCDPHTTDRVHAELLDGCDRLAHAMLGARLRACGAVWWGPDDPRAHDAEHFITLGHPWHPMVKTRLGLGWADNIRLAPELCARAEIATIELDATSIRRHGDLDALAQVGFDARGDTVRLPMLVAQWHRLAPTLRAGLRRVDRTPIVARSLASLRTVALDGADVHLKLALDVLTTSARRTVSPMSVANATVVSNLVERIQADDPRSLGSPPLALMRELAAAGLEPAKLGDQARQLGVIVRDATVLDASCVVCAALGEPDADGAPFVARLVDGYPGGAADRADAMFADYVQQLVPPLLRLWVAHGVALEAHLQNTLVRIHRGRPAGFVVRDLGGIRLHRGRLIGAGHDLELDPASFIVTEDEPEAADKWIHSVVHAHLAGVLRVLCLQYDYDEARGWSRIAACIGVCLDAWAAEPALRAAVDRDRDRLFAPDTRAKALLRMRLADRSAEYEYIRVDNPLALARAPC